MIDPNPALGGGGIGPSLYISDPVTDAEELDDRRRQRHVRHRRQLERRHGARRTLGIANVRHVSGGNQTAVVAANATVWELNVSGTASQTMTVARQQRRRRSPRSPASTSSRAASSSCNNGTLDAQFVEDRRRHAAAARARHHRQRTDSRPGRKSRRHGRARQRRRHARNRRPLRQRLGRHARHRARRH